MMIHDLDMARWLLQADPVAVSAVGSCVVDEAIGEAGDIDTAVTTLEFDDGTIATISNSRRTSYGYDQRIELHGSEGMLQAGNVTENTLTVTGTDGVTGAKPEYFFLERYADAYAAEWDHFVRVLQGECQPSVDTLDGAKALILADAAVRALANGERQEINWQEVL